MRRARLQRLTSPGFLWIFCLACVCTQNLYGQTVNITTGSPLPSGVVGTSYSQTFMATGGVPSTYQWSRVSGNFPAGLSLSTSGVLSGTPTASGSQTFRIRVTSQIVSLTISDEMNFSLEINPLLTILTTSLPNALQGSSYNQSLSVSGGKNPLSWSIVAGSGSLPAGMNLSNGGNITGTPTVSGTFNFTVRVTDSASPPQAVMKALSLIVVAPLSITTASPLPTAVQNAAYSQSLAATGGLAPLTWTVISGSPPAGVTLSNTGVLSGTPTGTGTSNFTVRVTDSSSPTALTAQKAFVLSTVTPLTISSSSPLPTGLVSTPYSQNLTASGGTAPLTWSVASGDLPAGLSLSNAGVLSGTATTGGIASFTLKVRDSSNPPIEVQKDFTLAIVLPLIITTPASLPTGVTGTAYSLNLDAAGGIGSYNWGILSGSLPAGLSLSTLGQLTGTPTGAGTSTFTVRVLDSSTPPQNFQRIFTLTIAGPLTITTSSLPFAVTGTAYSQTLVASGGVAPLTWSFASGSLPAGLALSASGAISGTPTTPGTSNFTVRVVDATTPQQSTQSALSIVVITPLVITSTSPLPDAAVGLAYSQTLTATGATPPYTWTVTAGAVPEGLQLSAGGVFQGTPTQAGTFNLTVSVKESSAFGVTTTGVLQLRVKNFLTIATASVPAGAVGSAYSAQLEAAGDPPFTWSVSAGALPPGTGLSATGLLSGIPTSTGTFDFTIRVATDSPSQEFRRSYQIIVNPAVVVGTSNLPAATRFTPYSTTLAATGGVAPFSWTIASGTLPAGLLLSAAGVISGSSSLSGTFNFTVQVTDAGKATATGPLTLTVIQGALHVATTSLPVGIQGFPFSQQFEAAGGPTPYTWALAGGSLPSGFTLNAAGLLQGTASATTSSTIGVRVTDSSGAADVQSFTIVIGPPLGPVSLNGLPAKVVPAQQTPITLAIPSTYAADLQGTLNLTYTSTAVVPINDPAVQFSTGGRTVKFTVPANTTNAVFPSPLMLVNGTVAGTVAFTGSIQNGPSTMQLSTTTVDSTAPAIMSLTATRITGGLNIRVIGFSPERRVTEAGFNFEVRVNGTIQNVSLTKPVEPDFGPWYQSPQSSPYGSAFRFEQLFTVIGDTSSIEAVTVTLKNAQGSTDSARTPFTSN